MAERARIITLHLPLDIGFVVSITRVVTSLDPTALARGNKTATEETLELWADPDLMIALEDET